MKVAYFDCGFGAAGDMLLGAMIDAGLPFDKFCAELRKLALPPGSFAVELKGVERCSLAAKKFNVLIEPKESHEHERDGHSHEHDQTKEHGHEHKQAVDHAHADENSHSHGHSHEHVHEHAPSHEHTHEHGGLDHVHDGGERHLSEILQIIENSPISANAKQLASRIFCRLGEAEAKVHGVDVEDIHFHEVGAIDAIIDIVGFAIAYDMLAIEHSQVSPLPVGSGLVKMRHGLFPVPGPAVINLLQSSGLPVANSSFKHECLTPTGAAILSTVATPSVNMPSMRITASGYGAGTLDPNGFPNVCRIIIGEALSTNEDYSGSGSSSFESEIIAVLEANLDDSSPQLLSFAMEQLFQAGALDVTVTPVVMKKSRSGHILSVICAPADRFKLEEVMLRQTSTLGVRSHLCERLVARREWQNVSLGNGDTVRVKLGRDRQGKIVNAQPEYEDCAEYATKHNMPLKQVIAKALANLEGEN